LEGIFGGGIMINMYRGINLVPDNLHPKVEGLESTAAQITTLKNLYDAVGRNATKVGELLGCSRFKVSKAIDSGRPTVILINEINGFFKYTLLK
jgi:hypothetical protein